MKNDIFSALECPINCHWLVFCVNYCGCMLGLVPQGVLPQEDRLELRQIKFSNIYLTESENEH